MNSYLETNIDFTFEPQEPWERSGYSELFEEFCLRKVNLGKILSVGGQGWHPAGRASQMVGSSHLLPKQVTV